MTFVALFALISCKAEFRLHSHSGSWCDYWTGLGLVNIQVIQRGLSHTSNVRFNMTLEDQYGNEYFANCTIEAETDNDDKEEEEELKEEETELVDVDIVTSKESVPRAYCYFTPPKLSDNLKYKENSLNSESEDKLQVADDFYVIAQKCNTLEEAEKIGNISLSFRQVNSFEQKDDVITFMFYGLTTEVIEINYEIIIEIYLFLEGGVKEEKTRQAICKPEEAVKPSPGKPMQSPFKCEIKGLEGKKFHTFNFFSSEFISGVPFENKILLDPVLTAEAIKNGTVEDCSLPEVKDKVPTMFVIESIDGTSCESKGTFKIVGKLGAEITEETKLHIPMTFPDAIESICTLPVAKPDEEVDIECKFAGESDNLPLIFEQRTLKHGKGEFLIGKGRSEPMTCINGELKFAQKLLDLSLSFRQLNEFKFSQNSGEITFNFFGLTTERIEKNSQIVLMVYLILEGGALDTTLSEATCILGDEVNPTKGQAQADFACKIGGLDKTKKYTSFELSQSEYVVGIPKVKTLLDPVKTAKAIEKGELVDFSLTENKEKVPVLFTPESIDGSMCSYFGEYTIIGNVNTEIEKTIELKIPVTYPEDAMSQCTIDKTPAGKAELRCVMGEQLLEESVMFEQQVLRDGMNEVLTLESIKSKDNLTCAEGNITVNDEPTDEPATDKTSDESTDKGSDETTDKGKDESTDEEGVEFDIVKKRAEIKISFRQINDFSCSSGTITVVLFALITEKCEIGEEVKIKVNLISTTGEVEEEAKEMTCVLESEVEPEEGKSKQGKFKCTQKVEGNYYSLRLNSSDSLSGIPTEEVLLDPKLTAMAIKKDQLLDYSKTENQGEDKMPATLDVQTINVQEGKEIIIVGNLSKEMTSDMKFTLPLTYPEGVVMICSPTKNEDLKVEFTCKIDSEIDDEPIILEQQIIKDGPKEVVNFGGFKSEKNITCSNGVLLEAEERVKIPIAFRQVSHLVKKDTGLEFFFAGLISEKKPADFKLIMKIVVVINEIKKEKDAVCTLQNNVESGDDQVQGNFNCEVALEEAELKEIKIEDTEAIQISSNNEQIAGVFDLEEEDKSPKATDIAIEETKKAQREEKNMTELAECLDYAVEENIKIVPPAFEVVSIAEDIKETCHKNGKFRIKGKFSKSIHEKKSFMLPLSFPPSQIKCNVHNAESGEEVDVACKVQKGFKKVKSFAFERRMVKKRHKEMVFFKSKKIDIGQPIECENYNTIRLHKVKERKKANFSFLQLSKFEAVGRKPQFFLALTRRNKVEFKTMHISIRVKVRALLNNLRQLEDSSAVIDMTSTCTVELKSEGGNAAGLKCLGDKDASGTPILVKLNNDEIPDISGIPDDADPSELPNKIDYSDPAKLNLIDGLPTVDIESVNGDKCEDDGSYTIKGKVSSGELTDHSNVEIPFGYPDASGLCDVKVNDKDVTMNCKSKDKFEASSIMFESTVLQDSENKEIFQINEFTNPTKIACIISVNSEGTGANNKTEPVDDDDSIHNLPTKKKSDRGLTGGAIAAIVISSVVVLAIAGILIALGLRKRSQPVPVNNNSTLNNLTV